MAEYDEYDHAAWVRVADVLKRARIDNGFQLRSALIAYLVQHQLAKPSVDRILGDLERAARTNYSPGTLAGVESWYGLAPGEIRRVLKDESDLARQARALKKASKVGGSGDRVDMIQTAAGEGWQLAGLAELSTSDLAALMARMAEELESRTRGR